MIPSPGVCIRDMLATCFENRMENNAFGAAFQIRNLRVNAFYPIMKPLRLT